MSLFWVIVIVIIVWVIAKSKNSETGVVQSVSESDLSEQESKLDEETVIRIQSNFEKVLQEEVGFPDSIFRTDRYLYRFLMLPWFRKLSSENRYNDEMIQKIRNDWVDYMASIKEGTTCNYLAMEFDAEKGEKYAERSKIAGRKQRAIEEAFASAVGGGAVEELKKTREIDYNKLSKYGDLAPDGMEYGLGGKDLQPLKS